MRKDFYFKSFAHSRNSRTLSEADVPENSNRRSYSEIIYFVNLFNLTGHCEIIFLGKLLWQTPKPEVDFKFKNIKSYLVKISIRFGFLSLITFTDSIVAAFKSIISFSVISLPFK